MTNLTIVYNAILNNKEKMYQEFTEDTLKEFLSEYGFLPLQTYQGWKSKGYQVKKGEKSIMCLGLWKFKRFEKKNEEEDTTEFEERYIKPNSHMFDFSQVKPIEEAAAGDNSPEKAEKVRTVAAAINNNDTKIMTFTYKPVEKPTEKKSYNIPASNVKALQKFAKNCLKSPAANLVKTINIDNEHGHFITDSYAAIYMDNLNSYELGMEENSEPIKQSFVPKYINGFNAYKLNLKELKAAYKAYKDTTKNKKGFFKIDNTFLDAKIMIDTLSIIAADEIEVKAANARDIVTYSGEYGKAIQCPVNPNGMDEKMVIGSIA